MKEELNELKRYLERYASEMEADDGVADLSKVREIMRAAEETCDKAEYDEAKAQIEQYIARGDVEKRKLALFCEGLTNRAVKPCVEAKDNAPQSSAGQFKVVVEHAYVPEDFINQLLKFVQEQKNEKAFQEKLFELMKKYDKDSPDVYKQAMMSRQTFSHAVSGKQLKKKTVWHIALGLQCTIEDADELLASAGFRQKKCLFDLTLNYCISHKIYDVMEIDVFLDALGQDTFLSIKSKKTGGKTGKEAGNKNL